MLKVIVAGGRDFSDYKLLSKALDHIKKPFEVVELFDAKTPSQVEWKRKWLEAARQHGASSF